ncbi:putative Ig domain-containing protein, partial [Luminiphilus sp.]|nr:putative Ig domain-containing protein [Luminiphilus sp.]
RVYDLKTFKPAISGTPNLAAVPGVAYQGFDDPATEEELPTERLTVSDPDAADAADSLIFSATADGGALPGWLAVDTATGALSGTPTAADVGVVTSIVLTVSDGTLPTNLPAFNLSVLLDTDGDGAPDDCDANCVASGFAADLDDDNDLVDDGVDDFPLNAAASVDTDNDNKPDDWNASCDEACQDASGLTLDNDDDGDGVDDNLDFAPLDDQVGGLSADPDAQEHPGSANNPYLISTLSELEGLSTATGYWASGVYLRLTQDIDASATSTLNVGDHDNNPDTEDEAMGFAPIGIYQTADFAASFDGGGHVIENLFINRPASDYVGLFGATAGAVISDVGVTNASITGNEYVGGLVGRAASNSTITASYATGAVSGDFYVGGLVASCAFNCSITASYATGAVTGSGNAVGGLVGIVFNSSITASYATGAVTGGQNAGGLVGTLSASSIINSYATGATTADNRVGGLVGNAFGDISITASYATGAVTGTTNVGGVLGNGITNSSITASYWDTETSTQLQGVGNNDGTLTGAPTGLSSAEMLQQSSFTDFDFYVAGQADPVSDTPWVMIDGSTRPYLYWQDDDGDGIAAYLDSGYDNDGVDDGADDFPLNASASVDTDGDGLPDDWNTACDQACQDASDLSLDGDDDNDGVADGEDTDPLDPNACQDLDGDSADDCSVGTDGFGPLEDFDPSNDGLDTDGDGLADVGDPDDDNDLVDDGLDFCPSTPSQEAVDAQGCSETQKDDDNDDVSNADDSCPTTPGTETGQVNTEGCGPSERDTDGDGVNDDLDAFPLNANETVDSDGDGYGDNEEISEGTDPNDPDDQPIQAGLPIWLLYEASKP